MSRRQDIDIRVNNSAVVLLAYPDWPDAIKVLTTLLTNLGELKVNHKRRGVIGIWFSAPDGLTEYFNFKVPLRYRGQVLHSLNSVVGDYVDRTEFEKYKGVDINDALLAQLNKVLRRQQKRLAATRRPILEEAFIRLGIPPTFEREKADLWLSPHFSKLPQIL